MRKDDINSLFHDFREYFSLADYASIDVWLYPGITLLALLLLTIVNVQLLNRSPLQKTVFHIHKSAILASVIGATIWVGTICFLWLNDFYKSNHLEASHLTSLILSLSLGIFHLLRLRAFFAPNKLKEIISLPFTETQYMIYRIRAIHWFKRLQRFFLLVPIGYLMLLGLLNSGTNLISFVIDNSSSMKNVSFDMGKDAIAKTLRSLGSNNHILITWFTQDSSSKESFDSITKSTNTSGLRGETHFYSTPEEAINVLNSIQIVADSPISEAVWQNYLTAKQRSGTDYEQKALIVITDGADNIAQSIATSSFFCAIPEFNEIYPSECINIIDIQGSFDAGLHNQPGLSFLKKSASCSYPIYNGSSLEEYTSNLDFVLSDYQKNWNLITWTIILVLLSLFLSLLIQTKRH